MRAKRNYKDSVFRDIFKNKRRLRNLYHSLSGEWVDVRDITINTLRGVFFNDIKNDISFKIGSRLVVLMEHQSTWNANMPLRMFWYIGKLLRQDVTGDMPYKEEMVKIPTPEFYMFYNGKKKQPYYQELKLSDAFMEPSDAMELKVKCYNINYSKGNKLLESCHELMAYSIFIDKVRNGVKEGQTLFKAVKQAIRYCVEHDFLREYFQEREQEVYDMVTFKWDDKRAKEVAEQEARDRGLKEGRAEGRAVGRKEGRVEGRQEGEKTEKKQTILGMLKEKLPVDMIARVTRASVEQITELGKLNGLL